MPGCKDPHVELYIVCKCCSLKAWYSIGFVIVSSSKEPTLNSLELEVLCQSDREFNNITLITKLTFSFPITIQYEIMENDKRLVSTIKLKIMSFLIIDGWFSGQYDSNILENSFWLKMYVSTDQRTTALALEHFGVDSISEKHVNALNIQDCSKKGCEASRAFLEILMKRWTLMDSPKDY